MEVDNLEKQPQNKSLFNIIAPSPNVIQHQYQLISAILPLFATCILEAISRTRKMKISLQIYASNFAQIPSKACLANKALPFSFQMLLHDMRGWLAFKYLATTW